MARRTARARCANRWLGVDVINFYNTGSIGDLQLEQAMTDEEMRAIVETAHSTQSQGRRRRAHGGGNQRGSAGGCGHHRYRSLAGRGLVSPDEGTPSSPSRTCMRSGSPWRCARSGSTTVADAADSPILARLNSVLDQPVLGCSVRVEHGCLAYGSDTGIVTHGIMPGICPELLISDCRHSRPSRSRLRTRRERWDERATSAHSSPASRADLIATKPRPASRYESAARNFFRHAGWACFQEAIRIFGGLWWSLLQVLPTPPGARGGAPPQTVIVWAGTLIAVPTQNPAAEPVDRGPESRANRAHRCRKLHRCRCRCPTARTLAPSICRTSRCCPA